MSEAAFFDTNIFLYTHDDRDASKQAIAKETLLAAKVAIVSTQVIQEFYSAATKKLRMAPLAAAAEAEALCGLPTIVIGRTEILRAIEIEQRYCLSFWDALIVAAAETAGVSILITEDLSDGQTIGTIRIVNPFRARQRKA
jgi:predicted nucleic acid-binding protein